ncbi:Sulfotransferase [Rhynchospora pubera]|uniref:Sulfotransferase n=1 Tax=Rhynchospora pubera TaxID=906938 RepID=A0AAV8EL28_9POAL|nr:Sulfotransferase [Rhynchospora pubera]KAJ4787146.1 Sulfotransferase [Rhynchospora pubera]
MANPSLISNLSLTTNPLKEKEVEEVIEESKLRPRPSKNQLVGLDSKYKELICSLQTEEAWSPAFPIRKYQDFWHIEHFLPGILAMQEVFKPRPSDILVASFLKSGTTWLKALTFTIVHRNKYSFSCHPLLKLNSHDCVPHIEFHYGWQDEEYLETLPSPRVLGTHLQYSMLSQSVTASRCPIVYICREPKDVIVSLWHMIGRNGIPFTGAFELFCEGRVPYGPAWDHVLEYYTSSLHNPEKILFLKYEEMMNDPIDGVMRLANFIGFPFSEEEKKTGLVEEIVEFCSFNKLKDLDVNKNNGVGNVKNDYFFRKAIVGDWQTHMTTEMATRLDKITEEKFHDSGFTY